MDMQTKVTLARRVSVLLQGMGALLCGLCPLLVLERLIPLFNSLHLLLACVYAALFVALCAVLLCAFYLRKAAGAEYKSWPLKLLLLAGGLGLTVFWQLYLNPVQIGPLLQNSVYSPLLGIAAIIALSWLPFVLIMRKIF